MTTETAKRLGDELARHFTAHVVTDEVMPGRFRFHVFSRVFKPETTWEQQDEAWEVVDRVMTRREADDISLLLTVGPEDVDASVAARMPEIAEATA